MKLSPGLVLLLAITTGQLFKFPQNTQGGATLLDLTILGLDLFALISLRFRLKNPPLWLKTVFIFAMVSILSLAVTPLKLEMSQYLISFAYTGRLFVYFLFGWVLYSEAFSSIAKNTEKILLFSAATIAGLGILQLILIPNLEFLAASGWDPHYFRTVSTLLDPNFTGVYLVLGLLFLAQKESNFLPLRWKVFIFTVIYLAAVTTFSRSALITLLVSFTTLSLLNKSARLFILMLGLGLGFGLSFFAYQKAIAEPRNVDREQSAEYRLNSWKQGRQIFESSPIFGVGFNSYRYALDQYNLGTDNFIQSRGSSANDSSLLFVLATTGIVGFFSYLAFLFFIGYQAMKAQLAGNKWGGTLLAGLIGLLASSFFINTLFYPWLLLWIVLIASRLIEKSKEFISLNPKR